MTLMVPGTPRFAVGASGGMGKTLDEIIKDRRSAQQQSSKKAQKKSTNSDRSIATGRAKREAAARARRGLSQTKKPNAMEIEREVSRQVRKTNNAKKKTEKKATGGRVAPNSSLRTKKKTKVKETPAAVFGGKVPSKKAVEAAVKGMEGAGFKIPPGHQVVMTFIPLPTSSGKKTEKTTKGKGTGGQKKGNEKKTAAPKGGKKGRKKN